MYVRHHSIKSFELGITARYAFIRHYNDETIISQGVTPLNGDGRFTVPTVPAMHVPVEPPESDGIDERYEKEECENEPTHPRECEHGLKDSTSVESDAEVEVVPNTGCDCCTDK